MNETQREVLRAIADTVVPSVERADDPHGFWALSGSQLGADQGVAEALAAQGGAFGAHMEVALVGDGPVTLLLEA